LIEKGILNPNTEQKDEDNFNTEAYLVGQYQGDVRKNLKDIRTGGERAVRFEDGILLPDLSSTDGSRVGICRIGPAR
jgi:sulfatase modifying factor 1